MVYGSLGKEVFLCDTCDLQQDDGSYNQDYGWYNRMARLWETKMDGTGSRQS